MRAARSMSEGRDLVVADLEKIRLRKKLEYWQKKLQEKLINSAVRLNSTPCRFDFRIKIDGYTKNQYTKEHDTYQ